jgi:ADP-heptose:LPS heptosyltransferase
LINKWVPEIEPLKEIKHEVIRQLDLVKQLGVLSHSDEFSLVLPEGSDDRIKHKLTQLGIDVEKPFILMHPGVSEAKRQYPAELFAKAAKSIVNELDVQILLTGVESERVLTEFIEKEVGNQATSIAGKLSLEELLALIKITPILISNNTGPVHIAAAFKTPVIVMYAATNPQHTPWKVKNKVLLFDVPKEMRSKNVVIDYAYKKSFDNLPSMVDPFEVVKAVKELIYNR